MITGFRGAWLPCAAALLVAVAARGSAQTNGGERSTADGVYTKAESDRGEETYMAVCVSCHPAGTYTAPAFRATWNGRPLGELLTMVSENMPKNDPASLTPEEYRQVIAYILKINGAPAGRTDLPAEPDALKAIRIVMPESK